MKYRKKNKDKWWWECKKHYISEKDSVWNPATSNCKIGNYFASIIDYSTIFCDEVIKIKK